MAMKKKDMTTGVAYAVRDAHSGKVERAVCTSLKCPGSRVPSVMMRFDSGRRVHVAVDDVAGTWDDRVAYEHMASAARTLCERLEGSVRARFEEIVEDELDFVFVGDGSLTASLLVDGDAGLWRLLSRAPAAAFTDMDLSAQLDSPTDAAALLGELHPYCQDGLELTLSAAAGHCQIAVTLNGSIECHLLLPILERLLTSETSTGSWLDISVSAPGLLALAADPDRQPGPPSTETGTAALQELLDPQATAA